MPDCRMELVVVGKALQPRRLPNSDNPVFRRVDRANGLEAASIRSRTGAKRRALSAPGESRVTPHLIEAALRDRGEASDDSS